MTVALFSGIFNSCNCSNQKYDRSCELHVLSRLPSIRVGIEQVAKAVDTGSNDSLPL